MEASSISPLWLGAGIVLYLVWLVIMRIRFNRNA